MVGKAVETTVWSIAARKMDDRMAKKMTFAGQSRRKVAAETGSDEDVVVICRVTAPESGGLVAILKNYIQSYGYNWIACSARPALPDQCIPRAKPMATMINMTTM